MRGLISIIFFLSTLNLFAQMPSNIPIDREPVRFFESTENIIFYIVIPLIIIILYWVWRKNTKANK